jgi:hypothetical protein
MPFDWMQPKRNPAYVKTLLEKRQAMYRAELAERAALLHRLGHARASVRARLAANIGWDFDGTGPNPMGDGTVDAVVDAIMDREYGGAKGASATRTKGGTK